MECYCNGMLQVWAVVSVCVCTVHGVCVYAHVLKQMRACAMLMMMIMIMVLV